MPTYVIAYRAPKDYEPGDAGDMAAWDAWRHSMGDKLRDFGKPVRDTTQIGDCGATQRFRGYSIITANDLESAVAMAKTNAPRVPTTKIDVFMILLLPQSAMQVCPRPAICFSRLHHGG